MGTSAPLFQKFRQDISQITVPEKFTFPFFYQPHELSVLVAKALQQHLNYQTDFEHNFDLDGKMFGVLVAENAGGELGYFWAFSGKLAGKNQLPHFVPTVFDMLDENGFFVKGIKELTNLNTEVKNLQNHPDYLRLTIELKLQTDLVSEKLKWEKEQLGDAKKVRKASRQDALEQITDSDSLATRMNELVRESLKDKFLFRELSEYLESTLSELKEQLSPFDTKIDLLKDERRQKSAGLQKQLFTEYSFLNQYQESKNLNDIFNGNPPAGSGECAAPKLLHYAFQHQLKPIALAEFWWGQSPKSEVRKHGQFYPACSGKCEPILEHMLKGIPMDDNPFGTAIAHENELELVYEDDYIAVVNKPSGVLSVPGKVVTDSVYNRMKNLFPNATGPLLVHRLDMATSGVLLIAKSSEIHKYLQAQFIKRKIQKRYTALLEGVVKEQSGTIDLPLRTDFDNRPNQIVCYEYGKPAKTKWEVIERRDNKTLVYFHPITGRTHQLRVHAAHHLGLNTPIVGDTLYGTRAHRLLLHAESITFTHPVTNKLVTVSVKADFDW